MSFIIQNEYPNAETYDKIHAWMHEINQTLNIENHPDQKVYITNKVGSGIGIAINAEYTPISGGKTYILDITDYSTW